MRIRQATPDDFGFIYETFAKSFREASTHSEGLSNPELGGLIENLIAKGWRVNVAEAEGYLAGWTVHANYNHLAWIYVREMFRRKDYQDFDVRGMLLGAADIKTVGAIGIVTPFLPNRTRRSWRFVHRPFLVVPNAKG